MQPPLKQGWLFLFLLVLFIPHWISSYHYIQISIGPDLLLRTIGSKLQEAGKQIYEYKWQPGDPIGLLNPYPDTRVGLNGVVSTPFLLRLISPFNNLSYCTTRFIWGFVQEFLLFFTTLVCCITFQNRLRQLLFIAVAAIFFVYDRNWLLNIYNGQMYILYAFVFALTGYWRSRSKTSGKGIIAFLAIASTIRPFFITAIIPFFRFNKDYVVYLLSAITISILLVFSTTSINEWKQYNKAMKMYAREQTGHLAMDTISPALYKNYADPCTLDHQTNFAVFGGGCLYSLQHYLYLFNIKIDETVFYQVILLILLLAVHYVAYQKRWLIDITKQLLLSFLFYQLCELLTPASRNPYNMIQWLPAVCWIICWGNKQLGWILVIGLCLNHDLPVRIKYERELGELVMFIALTLALLSKNNRRTAGELP